MEDVDFTCYGDDDPASITDEGIDEVVTALEDPAVTISNGSRTIK